MDWDNGNVLFMCKTARICYYTMNVTITLLLCSRSINKIYKQNLTSLFLCFLNPALLPIRNYHIFRPGMIQRVKFTEYVSLNTSLNLHIN